jgi:hypothetical protein
MLLICSNFEVSMKMTHLYVLAAAVGVAVASVTLVVVSNLAIGSMIPVVTSMV